MAITLNVDQSTIKLYALACQAIMEHLAVPNAWPVVTVQRTKPVLIRNVLTHVQARAGLELIVSSKITIPYVLAQEV